MLHAKMKLLVVDNEPSIRIALSQIFRQFGHSVRTAEDGFAALVEIRQQIPDILISDLNMLGMSGFELLSVVRRQFPQIHVIAMSDSFSGDGVPPGVDADVFYEKGTGLNSLLGILEAMTQPELWPAPRNESSQGVVWTTTEANSFFGEA